MEYYNQFSQLLSFVCSKNIVYFIQSWFMTHYRIAKVVLYAPLRLSPHLPYSKLATTLVKLEFSVNRLVFSLNRLAN